MMELNDKTIKQIIDDLNKSIELHRKIKVLYPDCTCTTSSEVIDKCFLCQSKEVIDDLDCLKTHLQPIAKNTINHIQFIDLESFLYSMGKTGHIESIDVQPIWGTPDPEPNTIPDPDEKPIGFTIDCITSRYAMDGNGSHVGYESITYRWNAYSKRELGITGIPYLLSAWVVNPNEFEIESKDLPPEDQLVHEMDCEFANDPDNFDDCHCGEFFEGYWHPEDDFFYQEIQSILESCDWIEADFNPDTREWQLGYTSFNVGEYQTNQDYADSCNEDNGMPSFGNYS